ncbi:ABC transporter permease [Ruania halotolerans]|uniref:ABC transporter permease n=1 Tax=Ruania halotolerans TaxID=2897773 RepID=UPI001E51C5E9|nr:FtsX-like permease family protein [Ruania halotolerans]UFU05521.1 FtsX-like permease family protein [Ruania halotolerans]
MRTSAGRLVAAGIAIMLGTAFVAASLLATATMERTTYNSVSSAYAGADLVLVDPGGGRSEGDLAEIAAVDGVAAVHSMAMAGAELGTEDRREYVTLGAAAPTESLESADLTEGEMPTAAGQVALTTAVADRLQVGIGDEITSTVEYWIDDPDAPDGETSETESTSLEVVGLLDEPEAFLFNRASALLQADQMNDLLALTWAGEPAHFEMSLALADGADLETVRTDVEALFGDAVHVRTVEEQAKITTAELAGNEQVMTMLLLAFATVALAVAALVIANTFQVLIAQRTRTLALLRCVGAGKAQVRRSVLLEAAILGLIASVAGIALGSTLVGVGLAVLANLNLDVPIDAGLVITPAVMLAPLLTGLLVTMLAALVPARMATRVAPLAALRPLEGASAGSAGRARAVFTGLLLGGGFGLLALAVVIGRAADTESDSTLMLALGLGLLGGVVSLVGLLVGSVFVVPRLIRLVGRLVGRGITGKIAIANSVRNPKRTASTASALLIGVALVTMMSTGAATARETLSETLDARFPVDLSVATPDSLSDVQISAVQDMPGVRDSMLLARTEVEATSASGETSWLTAAAVSDGDLADVLRDPATAPVGPGRVVVPSDMASWYGIEDGDELTLAGQSESGDATSVTVTAAVTTLDGQVALLDPSTFAELGEVPAASMMWARFADDVNERDLVRTVQSTLTDLSETVEGLQPPEISGAAVERAGYAQVVDTLLAVVLGLLGVSVVIALVGVANTLSLSVIERRRESAMLRALGLTKAQLRGMLAVEGVLMAGAGAMIGAVAGLIYGWAGSSVLLQSIGEVPFLVPWRDLAAVAGVALVAGLLASVLPARSAVRTSPVAALGVD